MEQVQHIIADNQPLYRQALGDILKSDFGAFDIVEASSFEELLTSVETVQLPEIIFLNPAISGMRGLCGLAYIKSKYPDLPIAVLSEQADDETISACEMLGVAGIVPKSLSEGSIKQAISSIRKGENYIPPSSGLSGNGDDKSIELVTRLEKLTPQQIRVLMLMAEGLLNKQIAYELGMSEYTVKAHISRLLKKLDLGNRTQTVVTVYNVERNRFQPPNIAAHDVTSDIFAAEFS